MDKHTKINNVAGLPQVDTLRAALEKTQNAAVRDQIASLFDDSTFVEIGTYTKRAFSEFVSNERTEEFEGVICGYGAIDGKLVFAFAEDPERMNGAIDDRHAKKIVSLYNLAIKNASPVIGIFNSSGADIFEGVSALSAYGRVIKAVSEASGIIPQIAYVAGKCIGTAATVASMFDLVVKADDAVFYVNSPALTGADGAQDSVLAYSADKSDCARYIRSLVSFLPDNASTGVIAEECADDYNRMLGDIDFSGDAVSAISSISDNGMSIPVGGSYAPSVTTAFSTVGGVRCGIIATSYSVNEGRLTPAAARKVARFVSLCDAFSIPIVTLVDSAGTDITPENEKAPFAADLAKLAFAYAKSTAPKVTVVLGHAIGASYILLGSKALGADITYALDVSEIGALPAESGVAFAWDKYITTDKTRAELVSEWRSTVASPVAAASTGEIDDIISTSELRARICSALLMLCDKGSIPFRRHEILPL